MKWDYIRKISQLGNKEGNLLLMLMDKYDSDNLYNITLEQAKEFYDWLIDNMNERTI